MIIGISGKIGSGKDTVGTIIQYLIDQYGPVFLAGKPYGENTLEDCANVIKAGEKLKFPEETDWEIKKFADKLKDITCLLIGCTREQLENEEFKNKELGEEWRVYQYADTFYKDYAGTPIMQMLMCSKEEYEEQFKINPQTTNTYLLTPRLMLQLIGTECGRNIIHPDIWVNSLMNEYKPFAKSWNSDGETTSESYPNWIITDMRFPNELKAVKDRNGITIRVNSDFQMFSDGSKMVRNKTFFKEHSHMSEISLDDASFDYVIDNNGNVEDLIKKVNEILVKEVLI